MKHIQTIPKLPIPAPQPKTFCTGLNLLIYYAKKKCLHFTKQCEICLPQNIYFTAAMRCGCAEKSTHVLFLIKQKVDVNCTNICQ